MLTGSSGLPDHSPCAGNPPVPPPFREGLRGSHAAAVRSRTGDRLQQKLELLTVHCWGFVTPCSAVRRYRRLGEICCLNLQGRIEEGGSEWPLFLQPQYTEWRTVDWYCLHTSEPWATLYNLIALWLSSLRPWNLYRISDGNTAVHTPEYTASQTEDHNLNNNSRKYVNAYKIYYFHF